MPGSGRRSSFQSDVPMGRPLSTPARTVDTAVLGTHTAGGFEAHAELLAGPVMTNLQVVRGDPFVDAAEQLRLSSLSLDVRNPGRRIGSTCGPFFAWTRPEAGNRV